MMIFIFQDPGSYVLPLEALLWTGAIAALGGLAAVVVWLARRRR